MSGGASGEVGGQIGVVERHVGGGVARGGGAAADGVQVVLHRGHHLAELVHHVLVGPRAPVEPEAFFAALLHVRLERKIEFVGVAQHGLVPGVDELAAVLAGHARHQRAVAEAAAAET